MNIIYFWNQKTIYNLKQTLRLKNLPQKKSCPSFANGKILEVSSPPSHPWIIGHLGPYRCGVPGTWPSCHGHGNGGQAHRGEATNMAAARRCRSRGSRWSTTEQWSWGCRGCGRRQEGLQDVVFDWLIGLGWVGLGWVGVGLGWVGLGWVGVGWLVDWVEVGLEGMYFWRRPSCATGKVLGLSWNLSACKIGNI